MTNAKNICPKCQSPVPDNAPGGLCPKCVLGGIETTREPAGAGMGDVPSLAQLAEIFPQLDIIELIGRGGMGFVFRARQLHLDREVALKLLPEKLGADPHFAQRFTREARVLAKLNHPNIVMVHDFGHVGGFYFLTMEYVEGLNLRQAMRMGKFSPAEALAIVPKVCDALQFAHEQGVLHRDIKPENILLDARGRVKIADFGIAKLLDEDKPAVALTGTGAALGTPHYMAPEQFENPSQVDHRADIYSLGVVFYEMLTGELPIGRFSAPSKRADLDERIDAVVLRALAKERELRQKDARELQSEVETLSTQAPAGPGASPQVREPSAAAGRGRFWKIAAALGVLFSLGLAFLNWRDSARWRRQYWEMIQQQPQVPYLVTNSLVPTVDSEKVQREEEAIRLARERYDGAKAKHSEGALSDRELALANRDLMVAEALGDALAVANAQYEFCRWDYDSLARQNPPNMAALWKAEDALSEGQRAIELAKAGTNELQRASAELSYTQRAWGVAEHRYKLPVERRGESNFVSAEALKKLEHDYLYAQLTYKRLKQKEDQKQSTNP